ncbi:MAG: reverse transcriptase domain-containing protein, partial [Patescibacteria group bacterium]
MANNDYESLFSLENIYGAWRKFRSGKAGRKDVLIFENNLAQNLLELHDCLSNRRYRHDSYEYFRVYDPKKRDIHKARVRDRIVHQIIFDYLAGLYEPDFIANSYASRVGKGTHQAVRKLRYFIKKTLANNRQGWVLKCDVRKYFDSIDKNILFGLINGRAADPGILAVIKEIIFSFKQESPGIPLGNVTSQIFANIYLHELDRLIKYDLGINEYIRYNDDFVIVGDSEPQLAGIYALVSNWLKLKLKLDLPREKMSLNKAGQGVDFLGYVVFPSHMILRSKTEQRLRRRVNRR